MKKLLIPILFVVVAFSAFGQNSVNDSLLQKLKYFEVKRGNHSRISDEELKFLVEKDTIVRVTYNTRSNTKKAPAYFINDILVSQVSTVSIEPSTVEKMFVENVDFEVGSKKYYGKIHIKLKDIYEFKPISINELKKKYLELPSSSSIFMINNKIVYGDYNDIVVNERGIYKIEVQLLEIENLNLNVINIITRTENNIKSAEEIRIRGEQFD